MRYIFLVLMHLYIGDSLHVHICLFQYLDGPYMYFHYLFEIYSLYFSYIEIYYICRCLFLRCVYAYIFVFFCVIAIEHDLETCVHVYQLLISRKLERYIIPKLSITNSLKINISFMWIKIC